MGTRFVFVTISVSKNEPQNTCDSFRLSRHVVNFLLIQSHEPGNAGSLIRFLDRHAVCLHNRNVVCDMRLSKFRRHGQRVVQIGERTVGIFGTGIKNSLCGFLYQFLLLGRRVGPGKVIVNIVFCNPIIAFQATANSPHP